MQLLRNVWPNEVDVQVVVRQQQCQLCKCWQQVQLTPWTCSQQSAVSGGYIRVRTVVGRHSCRQGNAHVQMAEMKLSTLL